MSDETLTDQHRTVLDTVWSAFAERGTWPDFADIDRALDRIGIDAEPALAQLSPRMVRGGGWVNVAPDMPVELGIRALTCVPAAKAVLADLVRVVRFLADAEREYDPTPGEPRQLTVLSDQVVDYFVEAFFPRSREALTRQVHLIGPLLQQIQMWSGCTSSPDGTWSVTLSRRIRDFRDVTTVEDLLAHLPEPDPVPAAISSGAAYPHNMPESEVPMTELETNVDPRSVFVVHGRDIEAKNALEEFLRALGLHPMEWEELVAATGSGAPYTGDAVSIAFKLAQAVIVLVTPDDEARLHCDLHGPDEDSSEIQYTCQPRPNVLFEAGMALASHPDRTIIAVAGTIRVWSDIAGRHTVKLTGAPASLNALANRLETAGCAVNRNGSAWLDSKRFTNLAAYTRRAQPALRPDSRTEQLPRGTILPSTEQASAAPRLSTRLLPNGDNYLLEISNRGGEVLANVEFELPNDAHWIVSKDVLPEYPIMRLEPREHIRMPVFRVMQSAQITDVTLRAVRENGEHYESTQRVSIYG